MSSSAYLNRDGTFFATPTTTAEVNGWGQINKYNINSYQPAGGANAGASIGSYTGVDAGLTAYKYGHDNAEIKLGLGVDTGAGIKNNSLVVKVLGCGLTLGDETGVSFFGSEIKGKNFLDPIRSWFS